VPVFLDTRGKSTLGIGICGRCSRKMSLDDLYPDPNYPGLRVCREDLDEYDPYRLPARQPETITLRFPRPDTPLGEAVTGGTGLLVGIYDESLWDECLWGTELYNAGVWSQSLWNHALFVN
jgi:hypothetical protein